MAGCLYLRGILKTFYWANCLANVQQAVRKRTVFGVFPYYKLKLQLNS